MSLEHLGIDRELVSTTAQVTLGSIFTETPSDAEGEKEWVYVFNDEASTAFEAGDIILRDPSATTHLLNGGVVAPSGTAAPAISVLGVAQSAIPAGSYGFILKRGKGLIKNGAANISADAAITAGGDRDGSAIVFAAGAEHAVIALSLEAEATDDTTFDAFISVP